MNHTLSVRLIYYNQYLHDFEEFLDCLCLVWKLLSQAGFHFMFSSENLVLPPLNTTADLDSVDMRLQLLKLHLALSDLVKGNSKQTVFMDLTDVMKT